MSGLLRPAPCLVGVTTGAAAGYAGAVAWMPGEECDMDLPSGNLT